MLKDEARRCSVRKWETHGHTQEPFPPGLNMTCGEESETSVGQISVVLHRTRLSSAPSSSTEEHQELVHGNVRVLQHWAKELLVVTSCPSKFANHNSLTQLRFEPQSTLDCANYRQFSCTIERDTELDLLWHDTNPSSSTQIKVPVHEHLSPVSVQLYTYVLWHI